MDNKGVHCMLQDMHGNVYLISPPWKIPQIWKVDTYGQIWQCSILHTTYPNSLDEKSYWERGYFNSRTFRMEMNDLIVIDHIFQGGKSPESIDVIFFLDLTSRQWSIPGLFRRRDEREDALNDCKTVRGDYVYFGTSLGLQRVDIDRIPMVSGSKEKSPYLPGMMCNPQGKWERLTHWPHPMYNAFLISHKGKIYAFEKEQQLQSRSKRVLLHTLYEFNFTSWLWTSISCTGGLHSLEDMEAALVKDTIFVLGLDCSDAYAAPGPTIFALDLSKKPLAWIEIAKFETNLNQDPFRAGTDMPLHPHIAPFKDTICIYVSRRFDPYPGGPVHLDKNLIWVLDKRITDEALGRNRPDSTHVQPSTSRVR